MSDEVTVRDVVGAVESRARRRPISTSTRTEIAKELGVARALTDPLVDEARDQAFIEEDERYPENWYVTDHGRKYLDAGLFDS